MSPVDGCLRQYGRNQVFPLPGSFCSCWKPRDSVQKAPASAQEVQICGCGWDLLPQPSAWEGRRGGASLIAPGTGGALIHHEARTGAPTAGRGANGWRGRQVAQLQRGGGGAQAGGGAQRGLICRDQGGDACPWGEDS